MIRRDRARSGGAALLVAARRRHRRRVVAGSVLFIGHQLGELMVPVLAGVVVDRAVEPTDSGALLWWLAALLVVFATLSTCWRWADRTISTAMEGLGHELRVRLAERSVAAEGMADRPATGHVVSVAGSDVQAVMGDPEASFLWAGSLAAIVATTVVVLWVSVPLGLIVVLGLPPVLALLQVLVRPIERRFADQQAEAGRAAARATDLLQGLRPLKGLRAEREASARYRTTSRRSLAAGLRASNLLAAQTGLATLVIGAFVAVVALVGGRSAARGDLSVGGLIAAVGATQFLIAPLRRIAVAAGMRGAARASADRIAAILDAPPAVAVPPAPSAAGAVGRPPRLELRGVTHRSLVDVDLVVEPGHLVAIAATDPLVGDALVALLGRWEDPDGGEIRLDGSALSAAPLRGLRRQVLVSAHDATLFHGTVRTSLHPRDDGRPISGDLLAATAVDEVLDSLHDGLDSDVGDRGLGLSGGQRQRIVLARSLALDPPILVLQEPTTAVDTVTEARIAIGLRSHRAGRTTIVITTSPALLAVADDVVFVDGGRVAARGHHDELLDADAAYRDLVTR